MAINFKRITYVPRAPEVVEPEVPSNGKKKLATPAKKAPEKKGKKKGIDCK